MSTSAIDLSALEALLTRQPAQSGEGGPEVMPAEHPLACELRSILANPEAHRIGDLARVVDTILREMSLFKPGHGSDFETIG